MSLTGKSRFLPYDHAFNSCEEAALGYFREAGAWPVGRTSLPKGNDAALLFLFSSMDALQAAMSKR